MREILEQFCPSDFGDEVELNPLGEGNINGTWLVRSPRRTFVLQRLNPAVFPRPELIMANLATLSDYFQRKQDLCGRRWEPSALLATEVGEPFYTDEAGVAWRAMTYIEGTVTYQQINTSARAQEVGWALGHFHRLLADLPPSVLHETLPGFHVLPRYLAQFDQVCQGGIGPESAELRFCLDFVEARRAEADTLERARQRGVTGIRVVHGDPKAANVLFDALNDQAVSLIDLDTVGPGLVLADIGDCLRSCCNPLGEMAADPVRVEFDPDLCRALLTGYLSEAGSLLTPPERELIFTAVRLITFELGLRFFTDHLAGDSYFKVSCRGQNLHRALIQFHLVQSIERQQEAITRIVLTGAGPLFP